MKAPRNWKELERHPLSAEYPDITGKRWERLVQTIRKHGVIAVSGSKPRMVTLHEGRIVDGYQLHRACVEADVKPAYVQLKLPEGMTVEEWVETVNDNRRHETQEQIEKRVAERRKRVAEALRAGMSERQISDEEGVSQSQIHRDKQHLTESGESVTPPENKVRGTDRRKQPSTKPPKPLCDRCQRVGKVKDCETCKLLRKPSKPISEPSDADETVIVDVEQRPVPEQARGAFGAVDEFKAIGRELDALVRRVEALKDGPAGRLIEIDGLKLHFRNAKGGVLQSMPTHVCPLCEAGVRANCQCCKGHGWTVEHVWKRLKAEKKPA
jgi:hypothetical protein